MVYPIARSSGPLLSLISAAVLLNESIHARSIAGAVAVVSGVVLLSGLLNRSRRIDLGGIAWGVAVGSAIAAYTIADGWAIKVIGVAPIILYLPGEYLRLALLAPSAWRRREEVQNDFRQNWRQIVTIGALAPSGYQLILFAMQRAPIGQVAVAREMAAMMGAVGGAVFLREKITLNRLGSIGLICLGVFLIAKIDKPM